MFLGILALLRSELIFSPTFLTGTSLMIMVKLNLDHYVSHGV